MFQQRCNGQGGRAWLEVKKHIPHIKSNHDNESSLHI
jgi:hypothetical protein